MGTNKIKVYIASPYSLGDKLNNVRNSLFVSNELINKGFVPIAPLLFHFQDMIFPQEYDKWLDEHKEQLEELVKIEPERGRRPFFNCWFLSFPKILTKSDAT